jgi:hypothetical protein
MDVDDVIQKLRDAPNKAQIARDTGIRYSYFCKLLYGKKTKRIQKPSAEKIDALRDYFAKQTRQ